MHFNKADLEALEKRFRTNLVNSLSSPKSLNLCATISAEGQSNLAIFNSVVHVGANPALLGMVVRPATVPRHTLANIHATGQYTLNHVHRGIYRQAHQTAAKYDADVSEFEACGLHAVFTDKLKAPYVREARIRIGLELRESIEIQSNGTFFVVGQVMELFVPDDAVSRDGYVDPAYLETLAGGGLDGYYSVQQIERLPYARPPKGG